MIFDIECWEPNQLFFNLRLNTEFDAILFTNKGIAVIDAKSMKGEYKETKIALGL